MSSKVKSSTEMGSGTDLVPKLRFPEFRDAAGWESRKVDDLVDTVTPFKKLQTSEYKPEGKFPIIDQSSNFICGWTNDGEAVVEKGLPVIVFGDHTCALKFVDRPFVQGADGIKIIRPKRAIDARLFFYALEADPVTQDGYKRHFSILREKKMSFPDFATGEQKKIADCLGSADALIAAQGRKVEALRAHKKSLMQQLFPQEGETQPRLRFPEFQDAAEWSFDFLGNLFDISSGGTPERTNDEYWNGSIPWITTSLVNFNLITVAGEYITDGGLRNSSAKIFPEKTILVAMYGQGKTRGQVAILGIKAATNQACAAILPQKGIDPSFVFLNLSSRYEELRGLSNSGGQENLSQGLIKGLRFSFPSDPAEQQRIADCLTSVDDLIAAETRKLDSLKTHKKGLMQQLFPQVGGADA